MLRLHTVLEIVRPGEILIGLTFQDFVIPRYRLAQLGVFSSVDLKYDPVDEHTRDVLYDVKEGKSLDVSLLFGYGLFGPNDVARTLSARYYKDGSEILIRHSPRPRRLTPRECARLMGFDRLGRPPFKIPVSDTQAYRQFGNAVVVPVVDRIAHFMLPHVLGISSFNVLPTRY